MDNINMQAESMETTADVQVTIGTETDVFDTGWDGDDLTDGGEDEFDMSEANGVEAEADQQEADSTEASEANKADTETPEQTEEPKDEAADQRFVLKHLDEVKEVDREEVIALAQKGMDYDRKVSKLTETIEDYEEFLKELADVNSLTIPQLMDRTRARMYQKSEAEANRTVSEADALLKVQTDRQNKLEARKQAAAQAEQEAEQQKQAEQEQKQNADIQRFVTNYPDVKAEDIPQSVWDDFKKSGDLTAAYARYEKAELQKQISILKQNEENRNRSTGSRKSAGAAAAKDPFDSAWDSF